MSSTFPMVATTLPVDSLGCFARAFVFPGLTDALVLAFDVEGRVDRDRLVEAVRLAVTRHHPVAGCRLERFGGIFYRWRRHPFDGADYLRGAYIEPRRFDLLREAPFRVHVGHGTLVFEMSHVAFDAVGFARLVRTVLSQYAAFPTILEPSVDELEIRRSETLYAPRPAGITRNPGRRFVEPASGRLLARRADPIKATGEPGAIGTHHHHLELPLEPIRLAARAHGATVNDWLAASSICAFERWNRDHGAQARFVSIDLPANLRPPERATEVAANVTGTLTINLDLEALGGPPSFGVLLAAFHAEKLRADREHRAWSMAPRRPTRHHPTELAVWLGRAIVGLLGNRLVSLGPTLLLSNFGYLEGVVGRFGEFELSRLRIEGSAYPAWTTNVMSPSSATMTLSFCVRKSHFSASTLAEFAGLVGDRSLSPCKS